MPGELGKQRDARVGKGSCFWVGKGSTEEVGLPMGLYGMELIVQSGFGGFLYTPEVLAVEFATDHTVKS